MLLKTQNLKKEFKIILIILACMRPQAVEKCVPGENGGAESGRQTNQQDKEHDDQNS